MTVHAGVHVCLLKCSFMPDVAIAVLQFATEMVFVYRLVRCTVTSCATSPIFFYSISISWIFIQLASQSQWVSVDHLLLRVQIGKEEGRKNALFILLMFLFLFQFSSPILICELVEKHQPGTLGQGEYIFRLLVFYLQSSNCKYTIKKRIQHIYVMFITRTHQVMAKMLTNFPFPSTLPNTTLPNTTLH